MYLIVSALNILSSFATICTLKKNCKRKKTKKIHGD